jgi:hypothetical protein
MKNKDINWYNKKLLDIKEKSRNLKYVDDPSMRKKMKKDLKIEQRGAKRSEKNNLKNWIKKEIDNE